MVVFNDSKIAVYISSSDRKTEEGTLMMETFGITSEAEMTYRFKRYQYRGLQDAINFARKHTQSKSKMKQEPDPDEDKKTD